MKLDFFFDFETRSRLDINKVNTVRYATHPSTEATLLTYCISRTGPVKEWRYGHPIPPEIIQVASEPHKYNFIAFNIEFDYMIWKYAFNEISNYRKDIPLSNLHDASALTSHFRVGNSLGTAAQMFDLPMEKDKRGRQIMLKQCKPNKKTGQFPELTDEEWADFSRYGKLDTRILREIYYRCPQLPPAERWVWEWTFRRNLQGIRVDVPLINELNDIVEANLPRLQKEFNYYVGKTLKIRSPKCKEWFQQFWPWIENMQKDTVRDMLMETEGKPEHAVKALMIKEMAGSTSISKIATAVRQTYFGRIYGTLVYHKAQTKRWAGSGIQIQNFSRPDNKAPDKIDFDLNQEDIVQWVKAKRAGLMSPIQFVKNLLRRIWIPDPGKIIYCGDFSKIEPTVLRWLAGMGEIPPLVYEEMAEAIYEIPMDQIGKDSEERQVGKAAELGGGYGMGYKRFRADTYQKTGIKLSTEMSKHVIKTYRKKNKPIVDMWRDLEAAFRRAVQGESCTVCDGKLAIGPMPAPYKGVQIRLPSGGFLFYHKAYIKIEEETQEIVHMVNGVPRVEYRQVMRENLYYRGDDQGRVRSIKLYGGQLTEHVTSAIAREILTPAMWRLEQKGFDVLTCIHDEVWSQAEQGREKEYEMAMIERPHWGRDIVVSLGMDNGKRYLK